MSKIDIFYIFFLLFDNLFSLKKQWTKKTNVYVAPSASFGSALWFYKKAYFK